MEKPYTVSVTYSVLTEQTFNIMVYKIVFT